MALEEVVSLSDSKVGYIYYYSEEKEEFLLHAWSKERDGILHNTESANYLSTKKKQAYGERLYASANQS